MLLKWPRSTLISLKCWMQKVRHVSKMSQIAHFPSRFLVQLTFLILFPLLYLYSRSSFDWAFLSINLDVLTLLEWRPTHCTVLYVLMPVFCQDPLSVFIKAFPVCSLNHDLACISVAVCLCTFPLSSSPDISVACNVWSLNDCWVPNFLSSFQESCYSVLFLILYF